MRQAAKQTPIRASAARIGTGDGSHTASSARIASQLRRAILEGEYTYGERLPPERELCVEFGAARGTVRAALDQLASLDFIARRVEEGGAEPVS